MSDQGSDGGREDNRAEEHQRPRKVDYQTKIESLNDKLQKKKTRFYTLSEEVFDVNQEYLSKSDELRALREKYKKNNGAYIDSMTEMALQDAELRYRKEHSQDSASLVKELAVESNEDVVRYRSELKYALQKYQETRRTAKRLQAEFSRLSDSSRVQSLNFLAFCRYSQSAQLSEINKLSVSAELPSKKELLTCKKEFDKCATKSRKDLANFYKLKIQEFQFEERTQLGKCKAAMERNIARLGGEVMDTATLASNIDHHMQVNSLENRVAHRLVAEAHAQLRSDTAESRDSADWDGPARTTMKSAGLFPAVMLDTHGFAAGDSGASGKARSRNGRRSAGGPVKPAPSGPLPSYAQPKRAQTPTGKEGEERRAAKGVGSSSASKAVPPLYRAQLSELYHSKRKAASAVHELHSARKGSVFDAKAFRSLPGPDSPVLQHCLLESGMADPTSSANLVQAENGEYVDQGQALGELMSQLCAAEGKFRQLNAIKEGLDVQLVKQAHFLLLIAKDLQTDLESKGKRGNARSSFPSPVASAAVAVQEGELSRAFAPPAAAGGAGKRAAGGAIGGKYRYRIDPTATCAAPFVPLTEIQDSYEESEGIIRKLVASTAEVLNVQL